MEKYAEFLSQVRSELTDDILPFWTGRMQDGKGGFYGRMDGTGRLVPDAPRGGILTARLLWTFSSAYRMFGGESVLEAASHAYAQIRDRFYDPEFGGTYWSIDACGNPLETKKQYYAIAFAVYGLAEYYRATGEKPALDLAVKLYKDIESHSLDPVRGGYLEAASRDWSPIADMRLSERDRNDAKTMNTHLHILEGYTGLYRVWPDEGLRRSLAGLVELFLGRIVRPDGHLGLFFNEDWESQSDAVSYGHDIESSWLLCETAQVLGDEALTARVRECSARLADAAAEGLRPCGGMIYEYDPASGALDDSYQWWVQAETVVGCLNQYRLRGDGVWLERALRAWNFIRTSLLCPDGEWYWSVTADGTPNTADDRAGFWKCPYHNGRMCMEILA
ncbi:MAG: AGE family epimerase/isomerase [Bacteroidales bacterium]|nr:AGE family epimerase/isomerase [Bacteroidales bacterium]